MLYSFTSEVATIRTKLSSAATSNNNVFTKQVEVAPMIKTAQIYFTANKKTLDMTVAQFIAQLGANCGKTRFYQLIKVADLDASTIAYYITKTAKLDLSINNLLIFAGAEPTKKKADISISKAKDANGEGGVSATTDEAGVITTKSSKKDLLEVIAHLQGLVNKMD